MIFHAFSKKLFGAKYERLPRTFLITLIVFWGLHIAGFQIPIAPSVFCLMPAVFTAGVMWQALSSDGNAAAMQNILMLPFERRKFIFSYIAAIGAYTLLTKTAPLLAVLLAVSAGGGTELPGSILCALNAVLMCAAVFSRKQYWYACVPWAAALLAAVLFAARQPWFPPLLLANAALACLLLQSADAYAFCPPRDRNRTAGKSRRHALIWTYFLRYMKSHKSYFLNTVILWCMACAFPLFFQQTGTLFFLPIGFAVLSINTPVCILLSCDPALEQAIRFLPGQKKTFCIPYCLFIFLCNITANAVFLGSCQILTGGVTVSMLLIAVFFAAQSAILSVLLEWFYPLRGWKIESDLWHHPRKYIVPAIMLLLAGVVEILPLAIWIGLLALEIPALLMLCRRG